VLIINLANNELIFNADTPEDPYKIYRVVYNNDIGKFHIIVSDAPSENKVQTQLSVYSIDPEKPSFSNRKSYTVPGDKTYAYTNMHWSCINGKLVGIYAETIKDGVGAYVPLISGDNLFSCAGNGQGVGFFKYLWTYKVNGQDEVANFFVTKVNNMRQLFYPDKKNDFSKKEKAEYEANKYVAIEKSFVPEFEQIVAERLSKIDIECSSTAFDPFTLNICVIQNKLPRLYNPFSPELITTIRLLEKEEVSLLKTAYFVYQYTTYPKTWHIQCKDIFDDVLPIVKQLYNVTVLAPRRIEQPIQSIPAPLPVPAPAPAQQLAPAAKPQAQGWKAWLSQRYSNVLKIFGLKRQQNNRQ